MHEAGILTHRERGVRDERKSLSRGRRAREIEERSAEGSVARAAFDAAPECGRIIA